MLSDGFVVCVHSSFLCVPSAAHTASNISVQALCTTNNQTTSYLRVKCQQLELSAHLKVLTLFPSHIPAVQSLIILCADYLAEYFLRLKPQLCIFSPLNECCLDVYHAKNALLHIHFNLPPVYKLPHL